MRTKLKFKYSLMVIFIIALLSIVTRNGDGKTYSSDKQESKVRYYYFYYDYSNNQERLKASPLGIRDGADVEIVLDSLLGYLSNNYFRSVAGIDPDKIISLKLEKIDSIKTSERIYKIAIVNIIDTNKVCMAYYFQGSTGAHCTYITLGTNLLQPQCNLTFLDGVIILYNGSPLVGLDHINIDGILIPEPFYMNAINAIKQSFKNSK
jgi:hypothetical protein